MHGGASRRPSPAVTASFWRIRTLWPLLAVLALTILLIPLSRESSGPDRLTNLDLGRTGFPDTYLMSSKTAPGRCYLVNRRESTVRRSDTDIRARMRDCESFGGDPVSGQLETWLVRSKRQGTTFLIPVDRVPDWTYPYLYRHVRRDVQELDLPAVGWTQLFLDRVYRGLFLRVDFPYDKRRKDGRVGELRELLGVREDRLVCADTRFQTPCQLYPSCVSLGLFPELETPHPLLIWLAGRRSLDEATVLLGSLPPHRVSLLPLPVSLEGLLTQYHSQAPEFMADERLRRWSEAYGPYDAPPAGVPGVDRHQLREEFTRYSRDFLGALRTHADFHRERRESLEELLPRRQASTVDLGIYLEGF